MSSDQADRIWWGPEAGSKIAGYRLEEQIGRGGMAVVYRARHEQLNRPAALKILPPALAQDTMFRDRFLRESRAAALVDHPNIVPIYDAGDSGGFLFIAMRYVPGGDVHGLLARTGPLPPARACGIMGQVAAALDAAHQRGLVHRDVKPHNMLLDVPDETAARLAGGGPDRVLLSDFGISKRAGGTGITQDGFPPGTYQYIAPERLDGRAVDGRADQYSLACAAFELLTGTVPFRYDEEPALVHAHLSEPPPAVSKRQPGLSIAADAVLIRALAKDPADRFDSCTTFARELRAGLLPVGTQPPTIPRRATVSALAPEEAVRAHTAPPTAATGQPPSRAPTEDTPAQPRKRPVLPKPPHHRKPIIFGAVALLAATGAAVAIWFTITSGGNEGVRIPLTINTCAGVARVPSKPVRLGTLAIGRPGVTNGNNNDWVGAAFAADCHLMAAAGNGQERILNLVAGLRLATLPVNTGHWVFTAAFTPDSKTLAVPTNDGVTELWDVTSGKQLAPSLPTDPNGGTWGVELSRDGRTLVTVGSDRLVEFWNVTTRKLIREKHVPSIGSLAISPNGELVAVGGGPQDGIEHIFRLQNGTQLTTLNSHAGNAWSVAFSRDNRTLAVATGGGLQWWNIGRRKLIAQETGAAYDLALSPDGKILAVGGIDSVVLRNASTHKAIATLPLGSAGSAVTGMAFSRYGGVLAVGWNGTLQFWNVAGVSRLS